MELFPTILSTSICFFLLAATNAASVTREQASNIVQPWGDNSSHVMTCYFALGDHSPQPGPVPRGLNLTLCTHIMLIGATTVDGKMTPKVPSDVELFYGKVRNLKKMAPSVKFLVTGGGNFTQVLNTEENRTRFAASVVTFVNKYGLDGVDMDWEFPTFGDIFHLAAQRHNLTLAIKGMRDGLDNYTKQHGGERKLVTMAVSAGKDMITRHYEPKELTKYVDFINVMTYDMHMYLSDFPFTGHNSPLYPGNSILDKTVFHDTYFAFCANEWVRQGMRQNQVMTGIPTYGHSYDLLDTSLHGIYDPCDKVGRLGDEPLYPAICQVLQHPNTTEVWDDVSKVPYMYQGSLWVSYDNVRSVTLKAFSANEWVKQGMEKSKVMTGIPTYAHTYNLVDTSWHGTYALSDGIGRAGDYLTYDMICLLLRNSNTTYVWDDVSKVPYLYQGHLWASYDNINSVTLKAKYLMDNGFSGAMVYILNADDFFGVCDGTLWPLFSAVKETFQKYKNGHGN